MAVGLAVRRLERLAVQHLCRQSVDRHRLAPERLSLEVLQLRLEGRVSSFVWIIWLYRMPNNAPNTQACPCRL